MADFSMVLTHLDGRPLKDRTGETDAEGKDVLVEMTLGRLAATALLAAVPGDGAVSGTDQIKRFQLAAKVHDAGELTLTADDRDLIKKRVEKVFSSSPIAVARAWIALDPDCGA